MLTVHQVLYYNDCTNIYFPAKIMLGGYYLDEQDAVNRLRQLIPNFKPHTSNTVSNGNYIGWISRYELGSCCISAGDIHNPVIFKEEQDPATKEECI